MFFTSGDQVQAFKNAVSKYKIPLMVAATTALTAMYWLLLAKEELAAPQAAGRGAFQSQTQNREPGGITEEVVFAAMHQPGGQFW